MVPGQAIRPKTPFPARGLVSTLALATFVNHLNVIAWIPFLPFIAEAHGISVSLLGQIPALMLLLSAFLGLVMVPSPIALATAAPCSSAYWLSSRAAYRPDSRSRCRSCFWPLSLCDWPGCGDARTTGDGGEPLHGKHGAPACDKPDTERRSVGRYLGHPPADDDRDGFTGGAHSSLFRRWHLGQRSSSKGCSTWTKLRAAGSPEPGRRLLADRRVSGG
jgi:hypothetical protein